MFSTIAFVKKRKNQRHKFVFVYGIHIFL